MQVQIKDHTIQMENKKYHRKMKKKKIKYCNIGTKRWETILDILFVMLYIWPSIMSEDTLLSDDYFQLIRKLIRKNISNTQAFFLATTATSIKL